MCMKENMNSYAQFVQRNIDYIPSAAQEKIRNTRILIAGCGMGSYFAEAAVRIGYEKFILVDHDTVELHNLNRQDYTAQDIGKSKSRSLAARMLTINPDIDIEVIDDKITPANAEMIVSKADMVFDTVDFIDLAALVALHDACTKFKKPVITAVSAGFGGVCVYFPAIKTVTFREMFDLPANGSVEHISYGEKYAAFIDKISDKLDQSVLQAFYKVVKSLQEGIPCPASQVAPGAMCVATMAGTIGVRIAMGLPVVQAPDIIVCNLFGMVAA